MILHFCPTASNSICATSALEVSSEEIVSKNFAIAGSDGLGFAAVATGWEPPTASSGKGTLTTGLVEGRRSKGELTVYRRDEDEKERSLCARFSTV